MHPEFATVQTATKDFYSLEDAELYFDIQNNIEEKAGGYFSVEIKIVKNYN